MVLKCRLLKITSTGSVSRNFTAIVIFVRVHETIGAVGTIARYLTGANTSREDEYEDYKVRCRSSKLLIS